MSFLLSKEIIQGKRRHLRGRREQSQTSYWRDSCTGPDIETQDKAEKCEGRRERISCSRQAPAMSARDCHDGQSGPSRAEYRAGTRFLGICFLREQCRARKFGSLAVERGNNTSPTGVGRCGVLHSFVNMGGKSCCMWAQCRSTDSLGDITRQCCYPACTKWYAFLWITRRKLVKYRILISSFHIF